MLSSAGTLIRGIFHPMTPVKSLVSVIRPSAFAAMNKPREQILTLTLEPPGLLRIIRHPRLHAVEQFLLDDGRNSVRNDNPFLARFQLGITSAYGVFFLTFVVYQLSGVLFIAEDRI
jgi:hypothetical protein